MLNQSLPLHIHHFQVLSLTEMIKKKRHLFAYHFQQLFKMKGDEKKAESKPIITK